VAARPGRARSSPVNRPNVEAAPSMMAPKYQKNATAVNGSRRSEEETKPAPDITAPPVPSELVAQMADHQLRCYWIL
jgi:hypothetical protein